MIGTIEEDAVDYTIILNYRDPIHNVTLVELKDLRDALNAFIKEIET
jgi:hypothetical protein